MTEHKPMKWIGGLLLFFGLLAVITIYSAMASGLLSHSFAQQAINDVINYTLTTSAANGLGTGSTANLSSAVSARLSAVISAPGCGSLCFVSSLIKSGSGINIPMNDSSVYYYGLIADAVTALGVVLIILGYRSLSAMLAIGRNTVSVGIISLVSTFIPFRFIIPTFASFSVSGYNLAIPYYLLEPFTSAILTADISVVFVGAALIIASYALNRVKKNPKQTTTDTKLIVTQR